ncbi:MAG: DUF4102 domain-containing protein [Acidobacteriota bacterium]|nr:DUF4102 domain-containing protein [Acidobacteriota bacterium]
MKLTDIQIKRIKPNTRPYKVSDGGGLFLWVTPSGGKIWRWTYRHEGTFCPAWAHAPPRQSRPRNWWRWSKPLSNAARVTLPSAPWRRLGRPSASPLLRDTRGGIQPLNLAPGWHHPNHMLHLLSVGAFRSRCAVAMRVSFSDRLK